ncbi:e9imm peptide [Streptomyces sp. NPDC051920]|uniref:e9imm peptide n=1 Tax=Streptomyces sp. NPDC051920 TaxID=3155523 RepID=UPI00344A6414
MPKPRDMDREEALSLVRRLMNADFMDEEEAGEALTRLERGLACPHISDYIYGDPAEPTAEQIVDRALTYKPFAL